jgi:predicted transcriptional regulator
MSSSDANKSSIDDAIIDLLFKSEVADQTEKLALVRIANKTQTSLDQVQMSLNALSSKNFVRRIYFQGKVGFELTPKGKAALEALAKARADRITKQLQESISQQRKAKLRAGIVSKMLSLGEKWQSYIVPDKKLMSETEKQAITLLTLIKEVESKQPLCHVCLHNYDQEFVQYKSQIEKLIEQNSSLNKAISNYIKVKECQQLISSDIENVSKAINRYEPLPEVVAQVSQLKTALSTLTLIQAQLNDFDKDQLFKFEEFRSQLADHFRLLESLRKPTHEFRTIKRESPDTPILYQDPEGPIIYNRKTSTYPLEEKCSKCGTKRKATPVNIG